MKEAVREELNEFGISHVTLELEGDTESCSAKECRREHHGWGDIITTMGTTITTMTIIDDGEWRVESFAKTQSAR